MTTTIRSSRARRAESGFTLVEALVAIVVLVFGLMAVTNLMIVAASSNTVANQGTAAVTSAVRVLDMLKSTSFMNGVPPGPWTPNITAGGLPWESPGAMPAGGRDCNVDDLAFNEWHCDEFIQGVGTIHTHWWITATPDPRIFHIRVRSEGTGSLAGARSRAEYTTFRSCTNAAGGCPTFP